LVIAKGSAAEVESMLIIATKIKYITELQQRHLIDQVQEVAKLLAGFIKKL
jgi:four helix bundle protein